MQVKAERPVWYLSVICGALLRSIEQVNTRSADYLSFLEKGQLPPARLTLISFEQQLVLEGLQPLPATCLVQLVAAISTYFWVCVSCLWHQTDQTIVKLVYACNCTTSAGVASICTQLLLRDLWSVNSRSGGSCRDGVIFLFSFFLQFTSNYKGKSWRLCLCVIQ